jgi:hypothetical protein
MRVQKRDVEKISMTQQCFFYLINSGTMGEELRKSEVTFRNDFFISSLRYIYKLQSTSANIIGEKKKKLFTILKP